MNATIYRPLQLPRKVSAAGLMMPDPETGYAQVYERVATLLGCRADSVDVQVTTPDYVAYSVFDYEGGPPNNTAMDELTRLTGHPYDPEDEGSVLRGPVLIVLA